MTTIDPRPYQSFAVQNTRIAMVGGVMRPMIYGPTGCGKTEIAGIIVRGAIAKGKRVAFLCNRVELVSQTSRRFTKMGIPHGVYQGKNSVRLYENVVVASIQTIVARGVENFPDFDLLVIDEAHAAAGTKGYRDVMIAKKDVPCLGLSATPFSRGLGKHYDELGGPLFDALIIAATIPELIADEYLVDCEIYAPSEPDMTGIKQSKNSFGEMDYSDADVGRAVDKPELIGDIVAHWRKLANDTPTVCFASNIAHSKHIVEQFQAVGVTAEHIDCYTEDIDRAAILERVTNGQTRVISNVGILCEGWDFPACKTLILARPTKSLIRYIQMAGRVLRIHETKDKALILDHSGTVTRLGFPTDEFPLELDDGKPKEAKASEKKERLPKACASCKYVTTKHKCPVCGFAAEVPMGVEVRDGELVKLTKGKKATKADKQDFYSQLLAIAAAKGYQKGWVSRVYKDYFGVWPTGLDQCATEPTDTVKKFIVHRNIRQAKSKEAQRAAA